MINNFEYYQPVKLYFGCGKLNELENIALQNAFTRGILICDRIFDYNGTAKELLYKNSCLAAVFSDFSPNPTLFEVMKATEIIKEEKADFVVAMGGGSSMDLAKLACSMAHAEGNIREYYYKQKVFENKKTALIAMPTTAGTGSEVTSVSVCNDEENGAKAPLNHNNFYADIAIIDPLLTLSAPQKITADTGIDALSHALEAFWSINHQPISDVFAFESCKLIFSNLEKAYINGQDISARENMALAALYAGLAFSQTKTAGCHACSYPLSVNYKLSHGEACGFTLDSFIIINKDRRLDSFSRNLGFKDAQSMAEEVKRLKQVMDMKATLIQCGITDTEKLALECEIHPLMQNNPVRLDKLALKAMFENLR